MPEPIASFELKGHKDVAAAFRDLRQYLPKTPIRNATRRAATMLAQLLALVAPKRTGKLARNIVVRVRATASTIRARVTVNTKGKADDPENAFYWRFLEKGFTTGRGKGKFEKFTFIAPTVSAKANEAAQFVVDEVDKAIDRAESKARRAL
jgi:HK97 gp10 family phage protein